MGKQARKTKMGRPPVMEHPCNVVLRLERSALEQAKAVAADKGMSLSEIMRRLLAEFVEEEGSSTKRRRADAKGRPK